MNGAEHLDRRAVATARLLALDVVEAHGHGHAGAPMGLAPLAHVLFQRVLRHDPADSSWIGRDRFILSAGHASLLLYTQLYLCGYELTLDDLRCARELGSRTPGHPERGHPPGVEMTTGPLGQGVGAAVGLAMAVRRVRSLLDAESAPGTSIFDHTVWCLASDGDLQEGVAAEACSLAGTLGLDDLVLIWDDNRVTIDGPASLAFREDVRLRFTAYGWRVIDVDGEDLVGLESALRQARDEPGRPTLVAVRTTIGMPVPGWKGTSAAHAGGFGPDAVAAAKRALGFDPAVTFHVSPEVLEHTRAVRERGHRLRIEWEAAVAAWADEHPDQAELLRRWQDGHLPDGWDEATDPDSTAPVATRTASGAVLSRLAARLPEIWGGSADLAESTSTLLPGRVAFGPDEPRGGFIHFGVREHAMAAILNGIALHGWLRPFGSTYLVFSDYQRPAIRLAAMMGLPVVYVLTHDSIAVGEDGPTHQPVEQLWSLRTVPGLDVVRPADAAETAAVWRRLLTHPVGPVALVLSRQTLPVLPTPAFGDAGRGGYVVTEPANGDPDVLLIATGSEVGLAVEAAARVFESDGLGAQVVSMPCLEWFERQPLDYQERVLPTATTARVSVEAGVALGWWRMIGPHGVAVSVEEFGLSGPGAEVMALRDVSVDAVVEAVRHSWARSLSVVAPGAG